MNVQENIPKTGNDTGKREVGKNQQKKLNEKEQIEEVYMDTIDFKILEFGNPYMFIDTESDENSKEFQIDKEEFYEKIKKYVYSSLKKNESNTSNRIESIIENFITTYMDIRELFLLNNYEKVSNISIPLMSNDSYCEEISEVYTGKKKLPCFVVKQSYKVTSNNINEVFDETVKFLK